MSDSSMWNKCKNNEMYKYIDLNIWCQLYRRTKKENGHDRLGTHFGCGNIKKI